MFLPLHEKKRVARCLKSPRTIDNLQDIAFLVHQPVRRLCVAVARLRDPVADSSTGGQAVFGIIDGPDWIDMFGLNCSCSRRAEIREVELKSRHLVLKLTMACSGETRGVLVHVAVDS
jgi:hypothetical protein